MARCLRCGKRSAGEHHCERRESQGAFGAPADEPAPPRQVDPSEPLDPPALDGYQVREILGVGGEGAVFAAVRLADGVEVAIKVTAERSARGRERLRRERDVLAAVGPAAVPRVYELRTLADGAACLVMERLHGPTLAAELDRAVGPIPAWVLPAPALALLDAVARVHAAGFVHCDLKPENVILERLPERGRNGDTGERLPDQVRLVDLGIAQPLDRSAPTRDDEVAGTAEYMAPEQCEAGGPLDARADVYALGVVLYEALTGRPPFFGQPELVRQAHIGQRPPRPSDVGPVGAQTEKVLLRCLAKDPDDRYPDVPAMRAALDEAFQVDEMTPLLRRTHAESPTVAEAHRELTCGVLMFTSPEPALVVDRLVTAYGGVLAHAARGCFAVVFAQDAADNPVRRAVRAARSLIAGGTCARALVDLAPVRVRQRKGKLRYRSPLFLRDDLLPGDDEPAGVLISKEALVAAPDLAVYPAERRDGWYIAPDVDDRPDHTTQTLDAIHLCPLVGRDRELELLLASARAAFGGCEPRIATVIGDRGVGKTRLGEELAVELASEARVVEVRALEPVDGAGDHSLAELVRALLDLPSSAPGDAGRALVAAQVGDAIAGQVWPAVALAMRWLSPDAPELAHLAAAPGALRVFLLRAIGLAIRELAARRPLAVVLDDAHLADDTTLDALELAALAPWSSRPAGGLPAGGLPAGGGPGGATGDDADADADPVQLWVCVLAAPAWTAAHPTWGERAAGHDRVALAELSAADSVALCRELLDPVDNVPAAALQTIARQTGGSPLLAVELIRGLRRDGAIRRQARGDGWYLATDELEPRTELPLIQWLAERELAALPDELAAHGSLAALLGDGFTADAVAGVLEELEERGAARGFPLDAKAGLRRLIRRNLIVPQPDGKLAFRHSVLRAALERRLPEPTRVAVHDAAYRYYRRRDEPDELAQRAAHAARSGLALEASRLCLELADAAGARHAYVDAERMYTQALALVPADRGRDRMHAHRGRGATRYRTGRYADSLADLRLARTLAEQLGDGVAEIEVLLEEATALDWMQEYHHAAETVERAAARAAGIDAARSSPLVQARIAMGRGRSAWRFSRLAEACELLESCAATAEPLGAAAYEVLVVTLTMLGAVHASLGRLDDSARTFARAMRLAEQHGDPIQIAAVCNNRRLLALRHGDREGLVRDLHRALQIGRELGSSAIEYVIQVNLGEFLYQSGQLDAARPHVDRALQIERRHFGGRTRPYAALLSARIHAFAGREDRLREILRDIDAQQERARRDGDAEGTFVPNEQVLHSAVDLASREPTPQEWDALVERAGEHSVEQELVEVTELRGLWALRRGRREEAARELRRALDLAARTPTVLADRIRARLAEVTTADGVGVRSETA